RKSYDIDADRIALLAWSSSGPVAYQLLAGKRSPFSRGYVAMSVWRPLTGSEIKSVEGLANVLDQSPDDVTTTFVHARSAYQALVDAKAVVRLSTYQGGHGWHDAPIPRLKQNLAWLFGDEKAPDPVWPSDDPDGSVEVSKDGNLVTNA